MRADVADLGNGSLSAGETRRSAPGDGADDHRQPGCLGYAYAEDILEPGLIRVSEAWRDEAFFAAHAASEHLKAWRADGAALGVFDRQLWRYDGGSARPL